MKKLLCLWLLMVIVYFTDGTLKEFPEANNYVVLGHFGSRYVVVRNVQQYSIKEIALIPIDKIKYIEVLGKQWYEK